MDGALAMGDLMGIAFMRPAISELVSAPLWILFLFFPFAFIFFPPRVVVPLCG